MFGPIYGKTPLIKLSFFFSNLKNVIWNVQILFNGNYLYLRFLPDYYLTLWLLISIPVYYLITFLLGALAIFFRVLRRLTNLDKNLQFLNGLNEKKDFFIFFCFSSILLFVVVFRINGFGSWRHFFFLNIFIAYISSYLIYLFLIFTKKKIFKILIFFPFLFILVKIYHFHPFESLYFNEILKNKNLFQKDHYILGATDALIKIISSDKKEKIKIGNISDEPLYRLSDKLEEKEKTRLIFTGQNYEDSDYIFNSFHYVKDPIYDTTRYKLPNNYDIFFNLSIDGIKIYEVYKKKE